MLSSLGPYFGASLQEKIFVGLQTYLPVRGGPLKALTFENVPVSIYTLGMICVLFKNGGTIVPQPDGTSRIRIPVVWQTFDRSFPQHRVRHRNCNISSRSHPTLEFPCQSSQSLL